MRKKGNWGESLALMDRVWGGGTVWKVWALLDAAHDPNRVCSVQSLSHVRLCDPMDCSTPGFPDNCQLRKLDQIHVHRVGDPSNHLILNRPLLLLTESTDFPQRGKLTTTQLSHALKVSPKPLSDTHPREKAAGPCTIVSGWCNVIEWPLVILANALFL